MSKRRGSESTREEAERLDQLHDEGALDRLPYTRLRRYAKEPSQVYAIRIPVSRLLEIRRLAEDMGEQPTSLLREWVLERLDAELAVVVREEPGRYEIPVAVASVRPKGSNRTGRTARGRKTTSTGSTPKRRKPR